MAKTKSHLEHNNFIETKFFGKVELLFAYSYLYFQQGGIAQRLLHHLKYKNMPELGVQLGEKYALEIKPHLEKYELDYIVPVPLHYKKWKKRGYNQSEELAKGLSKISSIPILNALKRSSVTGTQTSKSRLERWDNVNNIFKINKDEVRNKRVLLVDDVITTGATIEASAVELISVGCQVGVLSLATVK